MYEQLSSALTEKIEILTLVLDDETGNLAWAPSGTCWASVMVDTYRNLFSAIGVGTRSATVIIRPHLRLTLHQAIRWGVSAFDLHPAEPRTGSAGGQGGRMRAGDTDGAAAEPDGTRHL